MRPQQSLDHLISSNDTDHPDQSLAIVQEHHFNTIQTSKFDVSGTIFLADSVSLSAMETVPQE